MLFGPLDEAPRVEHVVAVRPPHLVPRLKVLHAYYTVFLVELAFDLSVLDYVCVTGDDLLCLLGDFLFFPSIRGPDSSIDNWLLLSPQVLDNSLPPFSVGTTSKFVLPAASISCRLEIRI